MPAEETTFENRIQESLLGCTNGAIHTLPTAKWAPMDACFHVNAWHFHYAPKTHRGGGSVYGITGDLEKGGSEQMWETKGAHAAQICTHLPHCFT